MVNVPEDLMFVQNFPQGENIQVPENNLNIPNVQPIINNHVPQEQNIQLIQENINNIRGMVNINRRPNQGYYAWYCLRHGDCFLTSTNREPRSRDSRCGVLDVCEYEFLGFLSLRDGINFYTEYGMDLQNYFENMNDGYTLDMFTNMISCPQRRNSAILY